MKSNRLIRLTILAAATALLAFTKISAQEDPFPRLSYPIAGGLKVQVLPFSSPSPDGTLYEYGGGITTLAASTNGVLAINRATSAFTLEKVTAMTNSSLFYLDYYMTSASKIVADKPLYKSAQACRATPLNGSFDLDFPSINAVSSADLTNTVTGALTNDFVILGLPAAPTAGLVYQAFVLSSNNVVVRAMNITASPVNAGSQTFRIQVLK